MTMRAGGLLLRGGLLFGAACVTGKQVATDVPPAQDYPLPRLPDAGLVGRETGSEQAKRLNAALTRGLSPIQWALFGISLRY